MKRVKGGQAIINKQLVKYCDFLIAIFWTRLGTHTGIAESGTIEEINEVKRAGKPVLLYFSSCVTSPKEPENVESERLLKFKNQCKNEGLIFEYESIDEFKTKIQTDITKTIQNIHKPKIEPPKLEEVDKKRIDEGTNNQIKTASTIEQRTDDPYPTITPTVYDEKSLPPIGSKKLPFYRWNAQNLEIFWYDFKTGNTSETLEIGCTFPHLEVEISNNNRTINTNALVYQTTRQNKTLKIVECGFSSTKIHGLFVNGQYQIVGWMGQPYIAVNGQANKLAKLIIEQGTATDDIKTLAIGEIWDIGDGWTLSAQSIDARASPRQVWLVLSKDGVKKDDKVIAQENSYVYYEKEFADEKDVPLFVTYVDKIFAGATTDMIQLRYTWAIGTSVTEPRVNDRFGNMEVVTADYSNIILKNKENIVLSPGQIVDIMGNLKFKVADDPNFLRFYPMISK